MTITQYGGTRVVDGIVESFSENPNETLSENSIAARFDVSRTPVRSVLQRLQEN